MALTNANSNSMNLRLLYPDICKFLAIFLVTCSHCAQSIAGITYSYFFGGRTLLLKLLFLGED